MDSMAGLDNCTRKPLVTVELDYLETEISHVRELSDTLSARIESVLIPSGTIPSSLNGTKEPGESLPSLAIHVKGMRQTVSQIGVVLSDVLSRLEI